MNTSRQRAKPQLSSEECTCTHTLTYVAHLAAVSEKCYSNKQNSLRWHATLKYFTIYTFIFKIQHGPTSLARSVNSLPTADTVFINGYTKLFTNVHTNSVVIFMTAKNEDDMFPSPLASTELFPTQAYIKRLFSSLVYLPLTGHIQPLVIEQLLWIFSLYTDHFTNIIQCLLGWTIISANQ